MRRKRGFLPPPRAMGYEFPMSGRVRLGELLVTANIISREQLDQALALQRESGQKLGKVLVDRGYVSETQVTQILSQQLSVPWVSLYHIDFSRQLLDLVPEDLADKYCLVPIFVRRVRGLGETLYVAMDDPTDDVAQQAVAQWSGLPVRVMIAPPSDIRSAIRAYYGGGQSSASLSDAVRELDAERAPSLPAAAAVPATPPERVERIPSVQAPPARAASDPSPSRQAVAPPASASAADTGAPVSIPPDDSPEIEAREISMPAPARGKPRRMITLTLLDGTQVNLPAKSSPVPRAKGQADPELTARDLVAALRAVSHGADATEIFGEKPQWEPLFAALLELLLKKHLIADWEFVEEYKKI
jgi:type IV pilus assembly protein PilB